MAVRYHLNNEIHDEGLKEVNNLKESTVRGIQNIYDHVSTYLNEDQIQEEDF